MKYTSLPYHFLRRGALTLVLSLIVASSFSAQVGIKTTLGKNQILVGDPLALQIEVNMPPAGVAVQLPEVAIADTANNVEVLRQTDWDTTRSDRSLLLRKEIILTAWDSGYVEIPRLTVPFSYQDTRDTAYSQPLRFLARTLPPDTVDLRPLKPIVEEPLALRDLLPYGLGVLGALLLFFLGWYYLRRRGGKEIKEVAPVEIPPHELALQKLDQLEQRELWQEGAIKEYHSELTFIVREYLEKRFDIQALEQTSTEILRQLDRFSTEHTQREQLRKLFQTADMVKFAKAEPPEELHREFLLSARQWIRDTAPKAAPENSDHEPTNE